MWCRKSKIMNLVSTHLDRSAVRCGLAAVMIGAAASTASAQWTVVNLNPAGTLGSWGYGVGSGQQVGFAMVGPTVGHFRASLWSGSAASWVNLHPSGMGYSIANGAADGQQVGEYFPAGFPRAALWSGTAASWVDLHPAGANTSRAFGVGDGQQVGTTDGRASLWSGSAASWVNLNPPPNPITGYTHSSEAYGASGGKQVGYTIADGGVTSASLWTGTAASWVNLHPTGTETSITYATDGVQQVGMVRSLDTSIISASLWTGSAASWVNLQPTGSMTSIAYGVSGGQQVGRAQVGGIHRASLWSGTAASWVDLHSFLPAGFASSQAHSITTDGVNTYIIGKGFNGLTGRDEAVMWVGAAPVVVCVADLDGGGSVTGLDLASLLAQWSGAATYAPCPPHKPQDLNQDCKVNGLDLAMLLGAWGPCP
jgi:hypothetical protein